MLSVYQTVIGISMLHQESIYLSLLQREVHTKETVPEKKRKQEAVCKQWLSYVVLFALCNIFAWLNKSL